MITEKLLTISQVADILQMNPAVIRKWIRENKIHGIKIGNKWRIKENDLASFLIGVDCNDNTVGVKKNPYAGCYSYPRWIEYSGLPKFINTLVGLQGWTVLRKIIEWDCFYNKTSGVPFKISKKEFSKVIGLSINTLENYLKKLKEKSYIDFSIDTDNLFLISLIIPLKTPVSLNDIDIKNGGLKNFPNNQSVGCRIRFNSK